MTFDDLAFKDLEHMKREANRYMKRHGLNKATWEMYFMIAARALRNEQRKHK